jgi:hypothetical protein
MNRTIEIEFAEEAAVEIPAVKQFSGASPGGSAGRRQFWIGWQLFGAE